MPNDRPLAANAPRAIETAPHWHLLEHDLFASQDSLKNEFLARACPRSVPAHTFVFFQGDTADTAYYLVSGAVRIFRINPLGKESGIFTRHAGEMFGLAEVVGDGENKRECSAQTQTACCYHEISKAALDDLLARYPLLAKRVMQSLGRRVRFLCEQIENLMVCDVTTRLLKLLVYLSYPQLVKLGSANLPVPVPAKLTQEQIAGMIGACQQTVSEALTQLEAEGLLHVSRQGITLLNPAEMLRRARA